MYYHEQVIRDGKDHLTKHFTVEEIACICCGLVKTAPGFMSHLEILRVSSGLPMTPTSGCRCPEHNKDEGGRYGSFHLTDNPKYDVEGSCAVDINWSTWKDEDKIHLIQTAKSLGWSIGKANSFCHLDLRTQYTDKLRVDFLYEGYSGV